MYRKKNINNFFYSPFMTNDKFLAPPLLTPPRKKSWSRHSTYVACNIIFYIIKIKLMVIFSPQQMVKFSLIMIVHSS